MYAFLFDRRSLTLLALGVALFGALLFFGGVLLGMGIQIDRTRSLAEPVPSTPTVSATVARDDGGDDVSIPSPASWQPTAPPDETSLEASPDETPAPFFAEPDPDSAPDPDSDPAFDSESFDSDSSLAPTSDDSPEITDIPPPSATGTPVSGTSETGGVVAFTVQVGAFSEHATAQTRLEELAAEGWTTLEVREVQTRGGATLFAVQLGRFDDRVAAEDEATRFEKATKEKPVVKILDESTASSEDPG